VGTKADRQRIVAKIQGLASDPRPHGSEKLAGYDDRYRIRQGNYRIIYLVDDKSSLVTVYMIVSVCAWPSSQASKRVG
jgi:mRNA interferase RelE/StbE